MRLCTSNIQKYVLSALVPLVLPGTNWITNRWSVYYRQGRWSRKAEWMLDCFNTPNGSHRWPLSITSRQHFVFECATIFTSVMHQTRYVKSFSALSLLVDQGDWRFLFRQFLFVVAASVKCLEIDGRHWFPQFVWIPFHSMWNVSNYN